MGLSLACVSADAATLFCAGVDFGLDKILLALEATVGLVFSFFAMWKLLYEDDRFNYGTATNTKG